MSDDSQDLVRIRDLIARIERRQADTELQLQLMQQKLYEISRRPLSEKFKSKLWDFQQYPPRVLQLPATYTEEKAPANPPQIAIVTPSYNYSRFLRATIDSVLGQSYPNLDYIVQDGGSTDGTRELLQSYGDKLKWRSERDTGQANALNLGFKQVDGEVMAYLNSDDTLLPGTLAYVARTFLNYSDIDVVYSHRIVIDVKGYETGRIVLPPHDSEVIKWIDYIPQETMFWRRRVWEAVGPLNENFRFALDWDFILRAQAAGFKFKRLPRFLACFRVHGMQKTRAMMDVGSEEMGQLRKEHIGRNPTPSEMRTASKGYIRRHVLFHRLYKLGMLKY